MSDNRTMEGATPSTHDIGRGMERFKEMLRALSPTRIFGVNQIDTFFNGLNVNDPIPSLNGRFGVKSFEVNTNSRESSRKTDERIDKLADQILTLVEIVSKKVVTPANGSFFQNQASTSGTLPSNTIPKPKGEMKAITTHSGATLAGPSVPPPSPSKEPSPDSTKLPPAPISTHRIPEPNPHQPPIPYPSRLNKEKLQGKDDIQIHSFLQMFKKIHFNISFSEALAHMPKFAKMVKDLLTNKEKLLEITNTPVNENCSAMILKKLPEKLGDTGRFLIPCEFYELESCMALADLGASINLMPLSVWKTLSLLELSTTRMTLELATRTIAVPKGITKDVFIRVGKFTFPADFVVVDYEVDPRVPLILGRHFLRTAHALVDVHGEKLTLLTFSIPHGDDHVHETDAFLSLDDSIPPGIDDDTYDSEGDILFLERLLDDDPLPDLPPTPHPVCLINDAKKIKSSIEDPPDLVLKDLPSHLEYAFLEGTSKLPVIIAKGTETNCIPRPEKNHVRLTVWKHLLIGRMLLAFAQCSWDIPTILCYKGAEDTKLSLLWEKCHFMVKEGIVLGHKISKNGLEVDRAKVDVIAKLPPPTVKGVRSFLGHAGFYRRFIQDFSKIAWPMIRLLEKDTLFIFLDECLASFKILKKRLTKPYSLCPRIGNLPFEAYVRRLVIMPLLCFRNKERQNILGLYTFASKTLLRML
ncbi:reverse transcriptase domain-containing protein [Tanacetum coccineum]